MKTPELIGVIIGASAITFAFIKFAFTQWRKELEKNEHLKNRLNADLTNRLENNVKDVKIQIKDLQQSLVDHNIKLEKHGYKLDALEKNVEKMVDKNERAMTVVLKAVKHKFQSFEGELIDLKNGDYLDKKKGNK
jgi:septal ring factor EnvC (AmiA/AmiB activator)